MSAGRVPRGVFWASVGFVGYAYAGFPLLLAARAACAPRPVRRSPITPRVSLIIAAHNEAEVIATKLTNLAALDYPQGLLEVIVASDGSNDGTVEIASSHPSAPLVLALPRQGKNATLNAAVTAASGEVLVFSDADAMLEPGALRALVEPLADDEVGGVAGDFRYRRASDGRGERGYWNVDRLTKRLQTRAGSVTSATGQLHAIRRELWQPIPSGVADDSFTSVTVAEAHRRLVFEPLAVAVGDVEVAVEAELRRKSRYIARGLRSLWLHRRALNPMTHGWYAVQLASHKLVRRLAAVPIVVLAVVTPALWRSGRTYRAAAVLQAAIHATAGAGWLMKDRNGRLRPFWRIAAVATYFDLVNLAVLRALLELASGRRRDVWTPGRRMS